MDNKVVSGVVIAVFSLLMAWGIWVTNGNFRVEKAQAVSQKITENVCSDVNQLKGDVKEIRVELKDQREVIYKNQEKILERLGSIHKSVKSNNK